MPDRDLDSSRRRDPRRRTEINYSTRCSTTRDAPSSGLIPTTRSAKVQISRRQRHRYSGEVGGGGAGGSAAPQRRRARADVLLVRGYECSRGLGASVTVLVHRLGSRRREIATRRFVTKVATSVGLMSSWWA
ncbi:hypothetical protein EXIGLDRAFT_515420 [Exidia glandulosa HHB12029]|uniref:Uncharacterized protein n=1 Tax=Exidia glandulosa HHB12029 TaxID=1314781 RepID=A0A165J926_EXIGL|nr:hypothetical protein EXIGLDRAFT_515420 [Exidia glandulosa HHB12029]